MEMNKLVSIITPCYNGEKLVTRLLDSILKQSYLRIEMFVIDDGSTDKTGDVVKGYISRFEQRGYSLQYIFQDNAGQSVAINRGLKLFQGDYLVWPDSDDFYGTDDAIEQMVAVLEQSDDTVSMVRCQGYYLDEETLKPIGKFQVNEYNRDKVDLFEDCLWIENGFWFVAGGYMVKSEKVSKYIPNKAIYTEKNAGQNWQLMLPLLYKHKCLTIQKYLYRVLVRKTSHSRGQYSTFEQKCLKYQAYKNTIRATLQKMTHLPESEKEKYLEKLTLYYKEVKFSVCIEACKYVEARNLYRELKNNPLFLMPKNMVVKYYCSYLPLGYVLLKCLSKLKSMLR